MGLRGAAFPLLPGPSLWLWMTHKAVSLVPPGHAPGGTKRPSYLPRGPRQCRNNRLLLPLCQHPRAGGCTGVGTSLRASPWLCCQGATVDSLSVVSLQQSCASQCSLDGWCWDTARSQAAPTACATIRISSPVRAVLLNGLSRSQLEAAAVRGCWMDAGERQPVRGPLQELQPLLGSSVRSKDTQNMGQRHPEHSSGLWDP